METIKCIRENQKSIAQVAWEVGVNANAFTWLGQKVWSTARKRRYSSLKPRY
ncbi:hypothetical protein [Bacillus xiapuensis]|uniref:hypothetical protein n=1 Tax=Bacillus xiapuensis TaxID=2014075 RepID=UPI0018E1FF96|nr:hypothetical protein [Bacillus xiapuensis]